MLPTDPTAELPRDAPADAVTSHLNAQDEMRHSAIANGVRWESDFPPLVVRAALDAAANEYSAAWESSRHQAGDHLRALRSAMAAADTILSRWHTEGVMPS